MFKMADQERRPSRTTFGVRSAGRHTTNRKATGASEQWPTFVSAANLRDRSKTEQTDGPSRPGATAAEQSPNTSMTNTPRVESKYNKGSNGLPIEEKGPANHRHFAREVAAETPFDVTATWRGVYVLHFFRDEYNELDFYATKWGMVETDVVGDESIFMHEDLVPEGKKDG